MKRMILIAALSLTAGAAFAHGGAGGGGGARVIAWQKAHPAICALDGSKLVLIANPAEACPDQ